MTGINGFGQSGWNNYNPSNRGNNANAARYSTAKTDIGGTKFDGFIKSGVQKGDQVDGEPQAQKFNASTQSSEDKWFRRIGAIFGGAGVISLIGGLTVGIATLGGFGLVAIGALSLYIGDKLYQ